MASPLTLHETPVCNVNHIPVLGRIYYGHPFSNALVHLSQVMVFHNLQFMTARPTHPGLATINHVTGLVLTQEGMALASFGQNVYTEKYPYAGVLQIGTIPEYPSPAPFEHLTQLGVLQAAMIEAGFHHINLRGMGEIRQLAPDEIIHSGLLQQETDVQHAA